MYEVKRIPEDVSISEEMGSKEKFWYDDSEESGDSQNRWLFKHPRPCTGEHWAEKVAEQVCFLLGIEHAKVELAKYRKFRGTVTENFAKEWTLIHGNELLLYTVTDYDPNLTYNQSSHTLVNILKALKTVFDLYESPNEFENARRRIAEYFTLDALISNTDRHHENWGVLFRRENDLVRCRLAPTFDHASSLGRELLDSKRKLILESNNVEKYANSSKVRGGVYWSDNDASGPSPFDLVQRASSKFPNIFVPALNNLKRINSLQIQSVVDQVPKDWMTKFEREFAVKLMIYNKDRLIELIK